MPYGEREPLLIITKARQKKSSQINGKWRDELKRAARLPHQATGSGKEGCVWLVQGENVWP